MNAASNPSSLMLAALAVPFAAALVIPVFRRRPNLREAVTLIAAVASLKSLMSAPS